jgi:predicted naringenin-chalcone synthase
VVEEVLASGGYRPEDVDSFFVVSCTGYAIPGLDLLIAGQLGMRPDLQRACILGMGCYGAFPGMGRAVEAAVTRPGSLSLVMALELCSVHLQADDSAEQVVAASLFADGAAAALVGPGEAGQAGPQIIDRATHCDYTTLDHMSFTVTDQGFQMYLSSYVPDVLAAQVQGFVDGLLARNGLQREAVAHWGIHPGSARIVDYVGEQLGLAARQVEHSHAVLHEYGNMSSATILFVLERIQRCERPARGEYGVLLAFGPGLTMEGMVVRW